MILFKTIRYKNILSTGNEFTEYDLDKCALTLIIGKNGGGKTTLIDAISYALYGEAFRDIKIDDLINWINLKNLLVELEFTIGQKEYLVRRGRKPDVFEIYVDGDLIPQDAKKADYQAELLKIIPGKKGFEQIVVLGSRNYTPFMKLTGPQRRAFNDEVLNLHIYTKMAKVNKENQDGFAVDLKEVDADLRVIESKLNSAQMKVNFVRGSQEETIDRLERKIVALTNERVRHDEDITETQVKISEVIVSQDDITKIRQTIQKYTSSEGRGRGKMADAQKKWSFYHNNNTCPTCTQVIAEDLKQKVISEEEANMKTIEKGLDSLVERIADAEAEQRKLEGKMQVIRELNGSISVSRDRIRSVDSQIESIRREIRDVNKDDGSFEQSKADVVLLQSEFDKLKSRKAELTEELDYCKALAIALSDGGLKAQVIKQYLPMLNAQIKKFLAIMNFDIEFEMNEKFEETIRNNTKKKYSYNSFSEGEKMRLDLAILFAWREIAKSVNSTSTNIMIMDEILDASLDKDGKQDYMDIVLTKLTAGTNTFIISHNAEQIKDQFNRVIEFKKVKKFSQMKVDK